MKKVTKIDKIQPSLASKKKLRVAAYCRVSTDSDAQLESLDAQKEHYKTTSPPVITGPLQGSTLTKVSPAPRLIKGQCSCD